MPPGPWSIPLLGIAHKIDKDAPHKTYTNWSKQYGDIISVTLFGTQKVVVVSSQEAIREVMVTKADYFSGNVFLIMYRHDLSSPIICYTAAQNRNFTKPFHTLYTYPSKKSLKKLLSPG